MQNSIHQNIENPYAVYEVLFYGSRVEVWCAIHVWRIIWHVFFHKAINYKC
jgi:hypothetical protein